MHGWLAGGSYLYVFVEVADSLSHILKETYRLIGVSPTILCRLLDCRPFIREELSSVHHDTED